MLLTVLAFVFVLGVLIFVHELGHFMAAKAVGIAVPRFSVGFGPATPLRFQRGETEYRLSWIPLGGYVKMASREEQEAMAALEGGDLEEEYPPERLFESQSLPARILVISAGVIMNVLFAWAVYTLLAGVYGAAEDRTTRIAAVRSEVLPEGAEALGGLPFGTRIESLNGEPVESWNDLMNGLLAPDSGELRFELEGASSPLSLEVPGSQEARGALVNALIPLWEARVGTLVAGGPAAEAGLEVDDLITGANGSPLRAWNELVTVIESHAGRPLLLDIERGSERLRLEVVPREEQVKDPLTGEERKVGRVGISPQRDIVRTRFGPVGAVIEGARRTWADAEQVVGSLMGMVSGNVSPKELGGPIFIGQISGQFARAGFFALLAFMAILSVNLAILNLLPIPVLDGGHLVFLLIEGVRGKPLSTDTRLRLTQVGLYLLLGLMVLALFNDLRRVVTG